MKISMHFMYKLINTNQKKLFADVSGNLGIAWFSLGVISQILPSAKINEFSLLNLVSSVFVFIFHLSISAIILHK